VSLVEDGAGLLFHRIHRPVIVGVGVGPDGLIGRMTADLDRVAPSEVRHFSAGRRGTPGRGAEEMDAWRGCQGRGTVCVVAADSTSFRHATLPGHLEARLARMSVAKVSARQVTHCRLGR
jgi:hypothetical protein